MEGLGNSIFTSCQRFRLQPVCRMMLEAAEVAWGPVFHRQPPPGGADSGRCFPVALTWSMVSPLPAAAPGVALGVTGLFFQAFFYP